MRLILLVIVLFCTNLAFAQTAFTQKGKASFYARKFHGRKTANGEFYHKDSMTAAHKTLAFGTIVKVYCEETGKNVVVRINDRGPFKGGRVIDLSFAAAKQLDIIQKGVAQVTVEIIEAVNNEEFLGFLTSETDSAAHKNLLNKPAETTETATAIPVKMVSETNAQANLPTITFSIQTGVYKLEENLQKARDILTAKGYTNQFIVHDEEKDVYKLMVGKFLSKEDALKELKKLNDSQLEGFVVKLE